MLIAGAFASDGAAFAAGDAGVGSQPEGITCPVAVGIACASDGFVLTSSDGGRSWRPSYHGTKTLEGLRAWPPASAIAWGPLLLILTRDGGKTWRHLGLPGPGTILWASFASPADGWVGLQTRCTSHNGLLGECGDGVFATTDGGKTWRLVARTGSYPQTGQGTTVETQQIGGGSNSGGGHGWLSGGLATYFTTDGGATWSRPASGSDQPAVSGVMADVEHGYALQYNVPASGYQTTTEVLATGDGGQTWDRVGNVGEAVTGLKVASDGSLWTVAEPTPTVNRLAGTPDWACPKATPYCAPAVWVSTDQGRTWSERPARGMNLSWVAPLDASRALAGAFEPDGRSQLLVTGDGGRTWTAIPNDGPSPGPDLRIGFWSATAGWGYGLPGDPRALVTTSDGGRTWRRIGRLPADTYDAAFTSPLNGWAETAGAGWQVTRDGGQTWQAVTTPHGGLDGFNLSTFGQAGLCALLNTGGQSHPSALRTVDDGANWAALPVPASTSGLSCDGAASAWAVQTVMPPPTSGTTDKQGQQLPQARLLSTGDGGANWRTVIESLGPGSTSLLATSGRAKVWVLTSVGGTWTLRMSSDGGQHWTSTVIPAQVSDDLFGGDTLSAAGAHGAWLLTRTGLWHTGDDGANWERLGTMGG